MDIVPQGRVFKGYEGGDTAVPKIRPGKRLPEATELAIGKVLHDEYGSGDTINDIASIHDYSIARKRMLLKMAGAEFRSRGSAKPSHSAELDVASRSGPFAPRRRPASLRPRYRLS